MPTIAECLAPNFGKALRQGDAGKGEAGKEGRVSDGGDAVGNRNVAQATAVAKGLVSDDGDVLGDGEADQIGAV